MKPTCLVGVLLSLLSIASGDTWYVDDAVSTSGDGKSWPTAFKTIHQGINAASEGDIVIVSQGTYYNNIMFSGANIVLTSRDPTNSSVRNLTIIDGGGSGAVVQFKGTEKETCVLTGFTIRNGGGTTYGAGISGWDTRARIEYNLITGNHGGHGGGLSECHGTIRHNWIIGNSAEEGGGLWRCNGTIQDNTISGNTADYGGGLYECQGLIWRNTIANNGAQGGGGLYNCSNEVISNEIRNNTAVMGGGLEYCGGRIEGNLITGNKAKGTHSSGGGLIYGAGTIINNTFLNNSSDDIGGGLVGGGGRIQNNLISGNTAVDGGGLAFWHGRIENNTIMGNSAVDRGGGLYLCDDKIRNNLIVGNSALGGLGRGGGLCECNSTIENNTVVANRAIRGGGFYNCDGTVKANCIIWANTATESGPQIYNNSMPYRIPTYSCIQGWSEGGEGNTAVNPVFADPDGPDNDPNTYDDNNYRLQPYMQASVCIDKGTNESWMQFSTDLDGNPRVFYGLSSNTVDMGAYEYGSFPFKVVIVRKTPNGGTELIWRSRPGDTYVVWSRPMLYCPPDKPHVPWAERATLPGGLFFTSWTDSPIPYDKFFYRVELKP